MRKIINIKSLQRLHRPCAESGAGCRVASSAQYVGLRIGYQSPLNLLFL